MLLTFDDFGENAALYRWIYQRCEELGLLREGPIGPVTIMHVQEYEALMGLASRGRSPFEILHRRGTPEGMLARFEDVLAEASTNALERTLDGFMREFEKLSDGIEKRLAAASIAEPEGEP